MSVPFSAGDTAAWTDGTLLRGNPDTMFTGVSTDSRQVGSGDLFVAVVGERFDAHAFLPDTLAAGAAGLLVDSARIELGELPGDAPIVSVEDTTRGLGGLAAGHRAGFDGPLVAITGSNGKTTTKEMCAAVLGRRWECLKNAGNLNNQFGLPLTLLAREATHRCLVVELGMNHRGEIAALAAIARPTVGVITNAGTAHIEHLGSREEIAMEKGDLVAALPDDGTAVLNADDPRVLAQASRTPARVLRFGLSKDADVRGEEVRAGRGRVRFRIAAPEGSRDVEVRGIGPALPINALAAAGAALAAGATLDDVAEGLASWEPVSGRLVTSELAGDVFVVDDSYNANPESVANALRTLAELPSAGRRIAVLGSMGELGAATGEAHREAGRLAAELGLDLVYAVGDCAEDVAAGAGGAGMPAARVIQSPDCAEASRDLVSGLTDGDCILVKGSRAARMERVVEALVAARGA